VPLFIKKVKRIAQYFNQSPRTAQMLRQELKSKNLSEKSLPQDVKTWWNLSFIMLERFQELSDHISVILTRVKKIQLRTVW